MAVISELLRLVATWLKGHGRGMITATTFTSMTVVSHVAGAVDEWPSTTVPQVHPKRQIFTPFRYLLALGTNHSG
jgi:hypothetical protein